MYVTEVARIRLNKLFVLRVRVNYTVIIRKPSVHLKIFLWRNSDYRNASTVPTTVVLAPKVHLDPMCQVFGTITDGTACMMLPPCILIIRSKS